MSEAPASAATAGVGSLRSGAVLSECGTYRWRLWRAWGEGVPRCAFIMLNPSVATADVDDPTIRKCVGFARLLGCQAVEVANLFALRSTDPRALARHPSPVGEGNDGHILWAARRAAAVILAWGAHGKLRGRGEAVEAMLRAEGLPVFDLGRTAGGHPRHPLYVPYTAADAVRAALARRDAAPA